MKIKTGMQIQKRIEEMTPRCDKDHRHNGWPNYETWLVALWMDQDSSEQWRNLAREIYSKAKPGGLVSSFTKEDNTALALKKIMEDEIKDECVPILDNGMYTDLLNMALGAVDFHSIARHYVEGIAAETIAK